MSNQFFVLGAGMTGLAAGLASGLPVYETAETPGGICSSYYMRHGDDKRLPVSSDDGETYRFELGGGHWIFGGEPAVLRFIRSYTPLKTYSRRSAVSFMDRGLLVPYPVDNNLHYLGLEMKAKVLEELVAASKSNLPATTMAEWLEARFGHTLYNIYFEPFHEQYTAGLFRYIAPQDAYKSPVDLKLAIRGSFSETPPVGYNTNFVYPEEGLNVLSKRMADHCDVRYGKRAIEIDVEGKTVRFEDGSEAGYRSLISTLPLNRMIELAGLRIDEKADPPTSLLVINIGAAKGHRCPQKHWVYIPKSRAGFHRVGFYSNVDPSFLPKSARETEDHVSIYVEKAYPEGSKPGEGEVERLCREVVKELTDWEWIEEADVTDPTWIDVAYTWSWPNSHWRTKAIKALESQDIYQVGRYGQWAFQGIAESIRDGLIAGAALKNGGFIS
jgi:protoporphyrinogen oxidase